MMSGYYYELLYVFWNDGLIWYSSQYSSWNGPNDCFFEENSVDFDLVGQSRYNELWDITIRGQGVLLL